MTATCPECGYPHETPTCPNPACMAGKSAEHRAHIERVRAERAKWQAEDDEFWRNWRRFYTGGSSMTIYHGTRLYAVDSRDVGTFGGRAKRATIKVYDGSCANVPRTTISGAMVAEFRASVPRHDRGACKLFLRQFLPSNDPYRVEVPTC